jgi:transcriptional regulator with XRE-family HTH domain
MNWQTKRSMSGAELDKACERFGISQAAVGRYLGVSERTANRYMKGITAIPVPSAMLLWSLMAHKEQPVIPKWVSPLEGRRD